MITEEIIKEIYKKFGSAKADPDIPIALYIDKLRDHHSIEIVGEEVVLHNLEEFNPFKRFLLRSLKTILEFDKIVVFVFRGHLLFFNKENNEMRVHIKPEEKTPWYKRIFRKNY